MGAAGPNKVGTKKSPIKINRLDGPWYEKFSKSCQVCKEEYPHAREGKIIPCRMCAKKFETSS